MQLPGDVDSFLLHPEPGLFVTGDFGQMGSFWEALSEWGPSAVSSASAEGGTAVIGYSTAVLMVAVYGLGSLAVRAVVLARRDVTS
jgi:hypothetical protein